MGFGSHNVSGNSLNWCDRSSNSPVRERTKEEDKKLEEEIKEQLKKLNTRKELNITEKLSRCRIIKLKQLAKLKNIKGYSTLTKHELIKVLSPICLNADFL